MPIESEDRIAVKGPDFQHPAQGQTAADADEEILRDAGEDRQHDRHHQERADAHSEGELERTAQARMRRLTVSCGGGDG